MKEILNYRYYVLMVLVGIAMVALFHPCVPGKGFTFWIGFHFATKAIALACLTLAYRAINYWNPKGKIDAFAKLEKLTSKLIEQ